MPLLQKVNLRVNSALEQLGVDDEITKKALQKREEEWQDPEWAAILKLRARKSLAHLVRLVILKVSKNKWQN